jgi:hypothetical protein
MEGEVEKEHQRLATVLGAVRGKGGFSLALEPPVNTSDIKFLYVTFAQTGALKPF